MVKLILIVAYLNGDINDFHYLSSYKEMRQCLAIKEQVKHSIKSDRDRRYILSCVRGV